MKQIVDVSFCSGLPLCARRGADKKIYFSP